MDRSLGVFNVRHVSGRNPTWICENRIAVREYAHGCDGGESDGVYNSRGREKAEPSVDEDEDGGDVNVCNCQNDDAHW